VLRSIAELAAYGALATLLIAASLNPPTDTTAGSAAMVNDDARNSAPVVTPDRGALLFTTKGCVGCHMHAALPNARMQVGPNLTGLPDRAATRVTGLDARGYVRQSLREPQAFIVAGYTTRMPDLHLSEEEIDSITAFLLASTR
jgi:mono/diheme cytochrome c family protein